MNRTQCLRRAVPLLLGASGPIIFSPALCAWLPYLPIKAQAGISGQHIPHKGRVDSVNSVVADQMLLTLVDSGPAAEPIQGGLLRGLAVTSARRMAALPDVRERMAQLGNEPKGGPTEDFARTIATEIPLWTGVARANNIKAE